MYGQQSSVWMHQELFIEWFVKDFVPVKKFRMPEDSKAVLLLFNFTAHSDKEEFVFDNISAVYLRLNVGQITMWKIFRGIIL